MLLPPPPSAAPGKIGGFDARSPSRSLSVVAELGLIAPPLDKVLIAYSPASLSTADGTDSSPRSSFGGPTGGSPTSQSDSMISGPEELSSTEDLLVPWTVRNTFVDTVPSSVTERDPSLVGFFHERRTHSCPSSPVRSNIFCEDCPSPGPTFGDELWRSVNSPFSAAPAAFVLKLAETLEEAPLQQLPSAGSDRHHLGTCKPCAFVHTKGCESGLNCQFCHLCDAGERKRRQKDKLVQRRTHDTQAQWQGACGWV